MSRPLVLIVIDNPHRELRGAQTVADALGDRGVNAHVCGKTNYRSAFQWLRPQVVVLPRITGEFASFARTAAKHAVVTLIPCEHGSGMREKVLNNAARILPDGTLVNEAAPEVVARAYVGGANQAGWLREANIFRDDQLMVTGTLNSDQWLGPRNMAGRSSTLGVATTNKSVLFGQPINSTMHVFEQHPLGGGTDPFWRVHFAAFEMAHALVLIEALRRAHAAGMPLSLRPHPHEYLGNWTEFQRRAAVPFVIDRSLHLDRWIRSCGAVITTFSTTGIDCVAQGVPTISLHRMIPQKFFDALPPEKAAFLSNISWAPATLEELDALLAQARNGTLALAPEGDSFDRFVAENFNVPRSRFACEVIAEDLLGLLQAAPKAMPPASNVTGAVRYWGSSLKSFLSNHRRENIYFPFSLRVRREAREFSRVLRSRAPVGPR